VRTGGLLYRQYGKILTVGENEGVLMDRTEPHSFLHARFIEFNVDGVNYSGNHIQAAAPYTVAGSYQHEFTLPASNRLIAKIQTELVGGHYTTWTTGLRPDPTCPLTPARAPT
jgi:hypothetical protein